MWKHFLKSGALVVFVLPKKKFGNTHYSFIETRSGGSCVGPITNVFQNEGDLYFSHFTLFLFLSNHVIILHVHTILYVEE